MLSTKVVRHMARLPKGNKEEPVRGQISATEMSRNWPRLLHVGQSGQKTRTLSLERRVVHSRLGAGKEKDETYC